MDYDVREPFINYKDEEENNDEQFEILRNIRVGFVSKVYGIIAFQILLTWLVIFYAFINSTFKELLLTSTSMYYICLIVSLICVLLPICCQGIYQSVPINYIVLTIFTLSYSWDVAAITCTFTFKSVMIALLLTFITVVALSIYAMKAKEDFTIVGGTLFVCMILLIFIGIIYIIIPIRLMYMIYLYGSLILFSIYLIYDTQLLIGKGERKFSEDDYILAAINIYLDIIILFLKILEIFGEKNK
jgi:FtsH-binding integral membrane protein